MEYVFLNSGSQVKDQWLPGQDIPIVLKDVDNPIGIELGTDGGTTTLYLLKELPTLTLHGIDPYLPYIDWGGNPFGWHGGLNTDNNDSYTAFMNKVEPYSDRYIHHKKISDEAVNYFEDESMDFIFIDGLHTYEQVLKDCINYYPKLKKGGLFCGHDFRAIAGVNKAVNEFALSISIDTINIMKQDVWYWTKPNV